MPKAETDGDVSCGYRHVGLVLPDIVSLRTRSVNVAIDVSCLRSPQAFPLWKTTLHSGRQRMGIYKACRSLFHLLPQFNKPPRLLHASQLLRIRTLPKPCHHRSHPQSDTSLRPTRPCSLVPKSRPKEVPPTLRHRKVPSSARWLLAQLPKELLPPEVHSSTCLPVAWCCSSSLT